jgi:hypothetical protein
MDTADNPRASRGQRQDGAASRDEATSGPARTIVDDAMAIQAQLQAEQRLLQSGTPGRATITNVTDTGLLVHFNPQVVLDLAVTIAGRPPYDLRLTTTVPPDHLEQLQAGAALGVRVDPGQPQRLVIDWARQDEK